MSLAVGGVGFALDDPAPASTCPPDATHRPFLGGPVSAEVRLRVHHGGMPALGWRDLRYPGSYLWAARETEGGFLLGIREGSPRRPPGRLLAVDRDWSAGDLHVRHGSAGPPPHPLAFPLDVVLVTAALAHRRGVVVHGASAIVEGRGVVLAGASGAGKTTVARLLAAAGLEVVGDERVVLRVAGDAVLLHGTPWAGELGVVSPRSAPVSAVFFLEHAPITAAEPMAAAAAAQALLPRCRLPFWDHAGMAGVLDTVADITRLVPCHRLRVRPDASVVDLLAPGRP